jgi:hypothetical protein
MFGMPFITGSPEIARIQTATGWTTLFDISDDPRHEEIAPNKAFGLWADGPAHPYRTNGGLTCFFCPSGTENYRIYVPGNVWDGSADMEVLPATPVFVSANTGVEAEYNHRCWIFGTWAEGANVWAIGHHEWYQSRETIAGVPGYNALANKRWVTAPIWMKSTDNGQTFTTKTGDTAFNRLYGTPEGWSIHSHETLYGWQHPSNIVKEGSYWYAFLDANNLLEGEELLTTGFSLIRWSDRDDTSTVQFWNGTNWQNRSVGAYWGNEGLAQPYVFFAVSGFDPYTTSARNDRMAQCLRYHTPTQQWLLFGGTGLVTGVLCYTRSKTLANPRFEANGREMISLAGGGEGADYVGNNYITVFDPTSSDQNFTDMGNTVVLVTPVSYEYWQAQTIQLNVMS